MNDTLKVKGTYYFEHYDGQGNLKDKWSVDNIVTSAGKAQLALLAGDGTADPFTYVAVGTDSTAVAVGDTTLTNEATTNGFARAAGTTGRSTTTVTNDTYTITKTFTATGSLTIEEVGIFNASSGGTMLSHALTTSKPLIATDTLVVSYSLSIA